jgi:hypothetical protein
VEGREGCGISRFGPGIPNEMATGRVVAGGVTSRLNEWLRGLQKRKRVEGQCKFGQLDLDHLEKDCMWCFAKDSKMVRPALVVMLWGMGRIPPRSLLGSDDICSLRNRYFWGRC